MCCFFHADSFSLKLLSVGSVRTLTKEQLSSAMAFPWLGHSPHGGIKKKKTCCFLQVIEPLKIAQGALSGQGGT